MKGIYCFSRLAFSLLMFVCLSTFYNLVASARNRFRTFKKNKKGAGEMARWLRAPTVLPKGLSSNPSNHMVAQSHP